jgi:hypothetical protein
MRFLYQPKWLNLQTRLVDINGSNSKVVLEEKILEWILKNKILGFKKELVVIKMTDFDAIFTF